MDDALRSRLFDPTGTRALVLARRPPGGTVVAAVVSDALWQEVVVLLRWTTASTAGAPDLEPGRWWRLAHGCADLLRRMPGLCDELGEGWELAPASADADVHGAARAERSADRLVALLRTGSPVALRAVAAEVDALGAAAITAYAEWSPWQRCCRPAAAGPEARR